MIILTPKEFRQYIKTTLKDINELDNIHIKLKKIIVNNKSNTKLNKLKNIKYNAKQYLLVKRNLKYWDLIKKYNIKLNFKFIQNLVEEIFNENLHLTIWCLKNSDYINKYFDVTDYKLSEINNDTNEGIYTYLHLPTKLSHFVRYFMLDGLYEMDIAKLFIKYIDIEEFYENDFLERFMFEIYHLRDIGFENPYRILTYFISFIIKYNKFRWDTMKTISKIKLLYIIYDENISICKIIKDYSYGNNNIEEYIITEDEILWYYDKTHNYYQLYDEECELLTDKKEIIENVILEFNLDYQNIKYAYNTNYKTKYKYIKLLKYGDNDFIDVIYE